MGKIKLKASWGLGMIFVFVFMLLLGLQYISYYRVVDLRKQQVLQVAKEVLADVGHDVELRELVRYINHQLRSPSSTTSSTLLHSIKRGGSVGEMTYTHSLVDTTNQSHFLEAIGSDSYNAKSLDTLALSDAMLRAFFVKRSMLDEYVLRNLYRVYEYDSIPQLISPRYLEQQIRYRLEQRGLTQPYSFEICDARGRVLYEYWPPGVLRHEYEPQDVVIHRLFVQADQPNKLTPYLRLKLDFSSNMRDLINFAVPGVVASFFVLVLGFFSVRIFYGQLSFQESRANFINNMTHELKTPVSSIMLSSQMLRRAYGAEAREGKSAKFLDVIDQESQRLKLLIDKVLQISLFDGKIQDISCRSLDVNEYLLQAAEVYSVHTEQGGGKLILELNAENTWIWANATHLTNILHNLLDNAVKYRSPARPLELGIYSENVGDQIVIRIEDNGVGIPEDSLKRVFDRYYRVSTGYRHDVKGFGLGLAYVKSIVKLFGGRIMAEKLISGGTAMVMYFPLHHEADGQV